jgi:ATP-binding cassette subfamily B protein/ATP-binding cassette subfamily C protein
MASPSTKPSDFWPYLRPYRRTLLIVAGLSMVSAAAALALPLVVRVVLDGLGDESDTGLLIGVLAALMVGGAIIGAFSRYLLARTAEGVVRTTRIRLGAHLLRLPIAEYDQRRTGDLLSRVGSDTTLLSAVVTSGLVELAAGVVVATGAIVLMGIVDVPLLLVTVTAVGVGVAVAGTAAVRIKRYSRLAQEAVGAMTASVERALVAVRTIRAYRAEPRETAALSVGADDAYAAGVKVAKVESLIEPVASVAVQAAFLSVLGVGGARVATGQLSVGDLVAFVMLLFLLIEPVVSGLRAWTTLMTGLGALSRIEEVMALPAESDRPNSGADAPLPTVPANQRIPATPVTPAPPLLAFDDVDFGYRDASPVLHQVSFVCPRGTTTAVVGPSGAGKSTIMALIERFYEVEGGRILLHGTDVRDLPREHLRRQIGYVEQEAPVLAGTIRENLLLGDPDATDDAMHSSLASVNLWHRIADAEGGLDAQVGDAGVLLSGGERQRLAIARALLAAPPLLLLDEPTASLDARNEAALQAAVDAVAEDRTLIVVAHRLSTVVRADQIVVLDGGRVVGVGSHAHLLTASDLYRELATTQLLA